jgi:hypothetical protein
MSAAYFRLKATAKTPAQAHEALSAAALQASGNLSAVY